MQGNLSVQGRVQLDTDGSQGGLLGHFLRCTITGQKRRRSRTEGVQECRVRAQNESGTKMKSKSEISIISAQKFPRHTGRTHVSCYYCMGVCLFPALFFCHAHSQQQARRTRMCPSFPLGLHFGFCSSFTSPFLLRFFSFLSWPRKVGSCWSKGYGIRDIGDV